MCTQTSQLCSQDTGLMSGRFFQTIAVRAMLIAEKGPVHCPIGVPGHSAAAERSHEVQLLVGVRRGSHIAQSAVQLRGPLARQAGLRALAVRQQLRHLHMLPVALAVQVRCQVALRGRHHLAHLAGELRAVPAQSWLQGLQGWGARTGGAAHAMLWSARWDVSDLHRGRCLTCCTSAASHPGNLTCANS